MYRLITLLLVGASAACAPSTRTELSIPIGPAPAILVGQSEVVVAFPVDTSDFPWPSIRLTDRSAGPSWTVVVARPGGPYVAAGARLEDADSLTLRPFPVLAAVVERARLYDCSIDTHVIICAKPLAGRVEYHNGRLIMRIVAPSWIALLRTVPSDSGFLRVVRPNRTEHWSGTVRIQDVSSRGGA